MNISQSVECPLTGRDTAVLSGNLSAHNGNGSGTVTGTFRRVLSHKGWAEVCYCPCFIMLVLMSDNLLLTICSFI